MASNPSTLKALRKLHLYFGLFIAPMLLFFAFTGAVQTLSLHEAAGTSYKAPAFLASFGQIHKNQTWMMPAPRPQVAPDARAADRPKPPASPQPSVTLAGKIRQHLPLKIFFLVVALGLFSSTLTGIYMAYKYERNKLVVTLILIAGFLTPVILLQF